ncbi:ketopantoate reductase PanE/ApbA C terminal-domain-containing protein [Biscogniauxia mediterranea]|nr:ketopantoate reductase PanE/ApbA C terminal-domain-containing protein [Biscogniauxia mediterranea]
MARGVAAGRARLLHTTAAPRRASPENAVPAEWLRRILDRPEPPPRLYAWTPANLPSATTPTTTRAADARIGDDDSSADRRRIYVLGVGNMGRLYATCLARRRPAAERPPITLVVHRRELLEHWAAQPGIELVRAGDRAAGERCADFDVEWWTEARPAVGPVAEPAPMIPNLVVATKAADALPMVDRLRGHLGAGSTVAFTQNGMCKLWPPMGEAYVRARFSSASSALDEGADVGGGGEGGGPNWLACVTTHGVTSLGPFRSLHAAPANALVGPVLLNQATAHKAEYLMEQLAQAPALDCRRVSRRELWVAQLEKLVVNSTINPLTAVLRCKNGDLFTKKDEDDDLTPVIDALVDEASKVLCALVMDPSSEPILAGEADRETLLERFSFPRLREMLLAVGQKVAENTSSMLQDVRARKQTEIDDFNGWLVETARYVNKDLRLLCHEMLIALVKDEAVLGKEEIKRRFIATKQQLSD